MTGESGLNRVVEPDLRAEDPTLDRGFLIDRTHLKPYPICHHILRAVDAVFKLAEDEAIDPSDVRSIEMDTYGIAVNLRGESLVFLDRGQKCLLRALIRFLRVRLLLDLVPIPPFVDDPVREDFVVGAGTHCFAALSSGFSTISP